MRLSICVKTQLKDGFWICSLMGLLPNAISTSILEFRLQMVQKSLACFSQVSRFILHDLQLEILKFRNESAFGKRPLMRFFCKIRTGMTAIELLISISIITAVSLLVLTSFSGMGSAVALERSARMMATHIRDTQNGMLSVRYLPRFEETPRAMGIHFHPGTDPNEYQSFIDLRASFDFQFQATELIETFFTDSRARINRLIIDGTSVPVGSSYNIIFVAPEATLFVVNDATGLSAGDVLEIELMDPSGRTKSVVVRTTGQVSVR